MPFRELILKPTQPTEEENGCILEDGDRLIRFHAKTFQVITEKLKP